MAGHKKGVVFDPRSARAIEDIVLRMMASDPRRRKAPKKVPRPGKLQETGTMLVAVEDIPAAKIRSFEDLGDLTKGDLLRGLEGTPPADAYVWCLGSGDVQPVVISFEASGNDPATGVISNPNASAGGESPADDLDEEFLPGPFVMGQVDGEGKPYTIKAWNMVPEVIHKGKLCQAKRMMVGDDELLLIDVEPCD